MSQPIRKTLTIVCEGSATEPNYFQGIVNSVSERNPDYTVNILPKPSLDELGEVTDQANKPSKRKKRTLRAVKNEPQDNFLPEEYKAQPLSYVWQAKEALKIVDEAWAVFDKDRHPEIEEAFHMAEKPVDGKKVHIAFSSIAFETWVLFHFEACKQVFAKPECRTKKKKHRCGQGVDPKDCKGKLCVTGYLKSQGYIAPELYPPYELHI